MAVEAKAVVMETALRAVAANGAAGVTVVKEAAMVAMVALVKVVMKEDEERMEGRQVEAVTVAAVWVGNVATAVEANDDMGPRGPGKVEGMTDMTG